MMQASRMPLLARLRRASPALALVLVVALSGCASLPPPAQGPPTHHFVDTADTELGTMLQPQLAAHAARSGVLPLRDGREALAARLELAALAQRSIDVQYYIWHDDASGREMIDALTRAAGRGVRVRVLLDDNATAGLDPVLARFDAPRNIEVRLFNPFAHRRLRLLSFLTDFDRLDRRMHNKSFTVDNQATIVGGRNIGDEYFDAGSVIDFVDLDVLAVGPIVDQMSGDFDRYWASAWSYPLSQVVPVERLRERPPAPAAKADAAAAVALHDDGSVAHGKRSIRDWLSGQGPIEWTTVHLVSDDPAKIAGEAAAADTVLGQLRHALGEPTRELEIVSAYFVLEPADVATVTSWARHGAAISILTNSLAATDVPAVHAGYARSRKPLLEAGVRLFEMKPDAAPRPTSVRYGSSSASLHAKTFEVDRSRVFVGSYNVDPRSRDLNTEMGFVIDSPALAGQLADLFVSEIPQRAYEVQLTPSGDLRWLDRQGEHTTVLDHEPEVSAWRLLVVKLLSLLPIDGLL